MEITISVDPVTAANTYHVNQLVRLTVPKSFGMYQANALVGQIVDVNGSTIDVNIDSTNFDVFTATTGNVEQPASLAPSGSRNLTFNNTTAQVPFQSLNDRGN